MTTSSIRFVALLVAVILIGCAANKPGHEATHLLDAASSNFSRQDNANAAWFVGRAATKPFGKERVREYFVARPELIERYLDGALIQAGTTETQENIKDMLSVLDLLATLPNVNPERINAVKRASADWIARIERQEESQRELARLDAEKRRDMSNRVARARSQARISCSEREQCDRAFGMAEVFVSQNADMKIQIAASSVIETYNATEKGKIALKVLRMPKSASASEISLIATCRTDDDERAREDCEPRLLRVYTDFREALFPFSRQ